MPRSIKYQGMPFKGMLEFLIALKLGKIQMEENEESRCFVKIHIAGLHAHSCRCCECYYIFNTHP